MNPSPPPARRRPIPVQPGAVVRGVSSLATITLLLALMGLAAGWAAQGLLSERRSLANQLRQERASLAAAAGLAWGLARLNAAPGPARTRDCPGLGPEGLRGRWIDTPAAGPPVARAFGLLARCSLHPEGPACGCGGADASQDMPSDADDMAPGFALRLQAAAGAPPGGWLEASGCDPLGACTRLPGDHAARSLQRQRVAWAPAFEPPPPAALIAGGRVRLCGPSRVEGGPDSAWLLLAGGTVEGLAPAASAVPSRCADGQAGEPTLQGPEGSPAAALLQAGDAALARAARDPRRFTLALLGREPEAFWRPPAAGWPLAGPELDASALQQAVAAGAALLWVDGPARLPRDLSLGDPARPVMLVVRGGGLTVEGSARLHGLLVLLDGAAPAGGLLDVQGAVLARGDFIPDAPVQLRHDPALLARLAWRAARLLPLPGDHEEP